MTKKYEVYGKERKGYNKEGEGKCITYNIKTTHLFAKSVKEAEEMFLLLYPECDEVLHRETKEIEMTPEEIAEQIMGANNMKKPYVKLKNREVIHGFEAYNPETNRRVKLTTDMPSPTGILINADRGILMDSDGNLYATDYYDRVIPLNDMCVAIKK